MTEETLAATQAPVTGVDDTMISDAGMSKPTSDQEPREAPGSIGRYVALGTLGAGAMGEVLAAYDPRLDRKVALKRIHPGGAGLQAARARLEREAQALAKLDHRNVVAVYDVVIHQDSVFVAMEFVEGQTLDKWMRSGPRRTRPWQEVVPVFADVGRGLAAVHAVGLIHRDVKPGNVMISADGRVRVMDFGLARIDGDEPPEDEQIAASRSLIEAMPQLDADAVATLETIAQSHSRLTGGPELTVAGALMGTPAYMAPEQFAGLRATARSDQFSFCVALHEALYGKRPFSGANMVELTVNVLEGRMDEPPSGVSVPAWLRAVILRGLAHDPEQRYASMDELIAALGTGELRRRRRRFAGVGLCLALIAASSVGAQRWQHAQRVQTCSETGDAIDELWHDDARASVRAGILATSPSYAPTTAERVLPRLDDYAESWRTTARSACTAATVEHRWDEDVHARARWCLEQRRDAMASLIERLSHAEALDVQSAVQMAAALQPPSACVDERALDDMGAPPDEALQPQVLDLQDQLAGAERFDADARDQQAIDIARDVQQQAHALPWLPLEIRALRLEAALQRSAGDVEGAEPLAARAYDEAARAGLWAEASSVASMIAEMIASHHVREAEARLWIANAQIAAAHATDPFGLLAAESEAALANVERIADSFDVAIEHGQRALAGFEAALGPQHPRVARALFDLAELHHDKGDYAQALALRQRALELARASLGPAHPQVGRCLSAIGETLAAQGDRKAATDHYEQALAIFERDEGSRALVIRTLNLIGMMWWDQGRYDEAGKQLERALALIEVTPNISRRLEADTINNAGLVHRGVGDLTKAREHYERALAIYIEILGPDDKTLAASYNNIAILYHLDGQIEKAEQQLARALEIKERALGPKHPDLVGELNNLGRTRGDLGKYELALADLERALAINIEALGPDSPRQAPIYTRIGIIEAASGDHAAAIAAHQRAVELLERDEGDWTKQLSRARLALANALWDAAPASGRDRPRARALVEQARDGYASIDDAAQAEICEQWLASHR